jgi:hypothetical protein
MFSSVIQQSGTAELDGLVHNESQYKLCVEMDVGTGFKTLNSCSAVKQIAHIQILPTRAHLEMAFGTWALNP